LVAIQAIQLELSGGWATPTNVAGITSSCTDGDSGGTTAFAPGNGPFVSAGATSIMFCGFRNSSTTSYTYDIHFTACTTSDICTLAIDREPGFHCSVCTPLRVFAMDGVSDAPSGSPAAGPFTYWYYDAAASSPPYWQPTSTLSQIQAVQVSFTLTGASGSGTKVQRMILLPNTLAGGT